MPILKVVLRVALQTPYSNYGFIGGTSAAALFSASTCFFQSPCLWTHQMGHFGGWGMSADDVPRSASTQFRWAWRAGISSLRTSQSPMLSFENRVMNEEKYGMCVSLLPLVVGNRKSVDNRWSYGFEVRLLVQRVEMLLFHRSMGPATCSVGVHLPSQWQDALWMYYIQIWLTTRFATIT